MNLILDIETIRNTKMISILPEPEPKSNLVKPEAIAKDIAEKKQKQLDKMALSPYYGQVACIGLMKLDERLKKHIEENYNMKSCLNEPIVFCEKEEKTMLIWLEKEMKLKPQIITFNGFDFDIPFLHFRYIFHGLESPFTPEYFKRYDTTWHLDLFQVLTGWRGINSPNSISLQQLGKVFGFEVEENFSGKDVQEAFDNGNIEKIVEHCKKDLILTKEIKEMMGL